MSSREVLEDMVKVCIEEREACADLADHLGYAEVAQAIRARTCANVGHAYTREVFKGKKTVRCGICDSPLLSLVKAVKRG